MFKKFVSAFFGGSSQVAQRPMIDQLEDRVCLSASAVPGYDADGILWGTNGPDKVTVVPHNAGNATVTFKGSYGTVVFKNVPSDTPIFTADAGDVVDIKGGDCRTQRQWSGYFDLDGGNDVFRANGRHNRLYVVGGQGNDSITGGTGVNTLIGSSGADRIVSNSARTTVFSLYLPEETDTNSAFDDGARIAARKGNVVWVKNAKVSGTSVTVRAYPGLT